MRGSGMRLVGGVSYGGYCTLGRRGRTTERGVGGVSSLSGANEIPAIKTKAADGEITAAALPNRFA